MSRALMPIADRLLSSWSLCSRSTAVLSSRACCSSIGSRNVVCSSGVQSPGWGGWSSRMEVPEAAKRDVYGMELMAVPKRKVTPSRKGKRNEPKSLKSVPVIAKCKVHGCFAPHPSPITHHAVQRLIGSAPEELKPFT